MCTESYGSGGFSKPEWTETSPIPPLPPSTMPGYNYCHIIECTYRLEFRIFVRGRNVPFIHISIPITIGSIPLRSSLLNPNQAESVKELQDTGATHAPSAPLIESQEFQDIPPPSYFEAMNPDSTVPKIMPRTNDTKDTHANWDFRPTYPVFVTQASFTEKTTT